LRSLFHPLGKDNPGDVGMQKVCRNGRFAGLEIERHKASSHFPHGNHQAEENRRIRQENGQSAAFLKTGISQDFFTFAREIGKNPAGPPCPSPPKRLFSIASGALFKNPVFQAHRQGSIPPLLENQPAIRRKKPAGPLQRRSVLSGNKSPGPTEIPT
jgi:hypothetical protein